MSRWAGEMEFDFVEDNQGAGSFVTTGKVVQFIRSHLARNEIQQAVRLYEQAGPGTADALLDDAKSASLDSQKALADMFVMARDFGTAARIYELAKRNTDAANMHEKAGDYASAARCFQADGESLRAAAALERAGNPAAAYDLYQKAGAHDAMAECLARQHRFWEAAQLYGHLRNIRGEVEMLRLVPVGDPNRMAAVRRLATLLEQYGHAAQATQLIVDTVRAIPSAQGDGHLMIQLIRLLEAQGRSDQAAKLRAHVKQLGGASVETPALNAPGAPAAVIPTVTAASAPAATPARGADPTASPVMAPDPFDTLRDPFSSAPAADGGGAAAAASQGADAYAFLKSIPIFGELAMGDMKDLYRLCQDVSFAPGHVIIEQGVKGTGLTIVLEGTVKVLLVQGDKTVPLAELGSGKYVGEVSLVDDAPTSARVVAHSPVRALFLPRERFDHFLYSREGAAMRIYRLFTRTLAERLRVANQRK